MSPMGQLWVVFRKEVVDAFRDRRAIMTIVLSAAISPLLSAS
jgi:ABC-type Na+ efflux pump permease subunit